MKKIIALIAVVATMVSLFALPVSAKNYFVDDFDNPPASGVLTDLEGWTFYSPTMMGEVEFTDGALKITHPDGTGRPFPYKSYHASASHVLMFDLMVDYSNAPAGKCRLSCQFRIGGGSDRTIYDTISESHLASGVWYEFMVIVTNNENVKIYKKEKAATDGVWTLVFNKPRNGSLGSDTTLHKIGFDMNPITGCEIWFDNWMAYDEYWFNNMNISFEDATVEEIADVVSGGTVSVDFELYDGSVSFNNDMTIATNTTAKTVMVALDKDMKMVSCSTVNIPLKGGLNTVSATLELSDDADAANYFGNLADGGQINFYMWNNMQPLCDPIVID